MQMNPRSAPKHAHLAQALALCKRLDVAEGCARKARAALVIARYEIDRVRLGTLPAARRRGCG
jgi:hypothetical protein